MKVRAVLDTSALLGPLRHELVFLASRRVFIMVWSPFLIAELTRLRTEWAIKGGLSRAWYRERINALIREISRTATTVNYTRLDGGNFQTWLRDPDDEPLLATALVGRAPYIVSHNTNDFPPGGVFAGVSYVTPEAFLELIYQEYPPRESWLAALDRYRLP